MALGKAHEQCVEHSTKTRVLKDHGLKQVLRNLSLNSASS